MGELLSWRTCGSEGASGVLEVVPGRSSPPDWLQLAALAPAGSAPPPPATEPPRRGQGGILGISALPGAAYPHYQQPPSSTPATTIVSVLLRLQKSY